MKELLLILLCFPFIGFSQNTHGDPYPISGRGWVTNGDVKRSANEKWMEKVADRGVLKYRAEMLGNQKHGFYRAYFSDSTLSQKCNYIYGKKNGPDSIWYSNGQLSSIINYTDGEKNGLFRKWHRNGQLEEEGGWKNSKKEGNWKTYREDASLISQENYTNNKMDSYLCYYNSDQLFYQINYEHSKNNTASHFKEYYLDALRKYKEWYKNGQLKSEVNYVDDKGNGTAKTYSEDGELELQIILTNYRVKCFDKNNQSLRCRRRPHGQEKGYRNWNHFDVFVTDRQQIKESKNKTEKRKKRKKNRKR